MMKNDFIGSRVAAILAALMLAGCGSSATAATGPDSAPSGTFLGERKPLGGGTAVAWVHSDAHGNPISFGVTLDESALNSLGSTRAEIALAFPSGPNVGVRTAVIDWNPYGHPPAHVYDVPHFDFHFYSIDEATRMAIAPGGPAAAATPSTDLVPSGFVTDGGTVPMMGKHFISGAQPEFHGGSFTATPIYGYWDGHLAFVESMITVAYLRSHPSLAAALPQPAHFERGGLYPTRWAVTYNASTHRYDIAFSGLASR